MMKRQTVGSSKLFFTATLFFAAQAYAQTTDRWQLSTDSPVTERVIIDKRPRLSCTLEAAYDRERILVILDDIDITAMLVWTDKGFSYKPPTILPSGPHRLQIVFDAEITDIAFETRHSERYKTLRADIDLAGENSHPFTQEAVDGSEGSSIDASMGVHIHAETQRWDTAFTSHLHYADPNRNKEQSDSIALNDFLFRSRYTEAQGSATLEIGDVSIHQSDMTLSRLSRRGMQLNVQYKGISLNTFSVLVIRPTVSTTCRASAWKIRKTSTAPPSRRRSFPAGPVSD
jgi:hypothetical protein